MSKSLMTCPHVLGRALRSEDKSKRMYEEVIAQPVKQGQFDRAPVPRAGVGDPGIIETTVNLAVRPI
jgi:hypothetical protein